MQNYILNRQDMSTLLWMNDVCVLNVKVHVLPSFQRGTKHACLRMGDECFIWNMAHKTVVLR